MKDGQGRTIDYLRISLTDRCNMRCIYCMPETGVKTMSHEEILRIEEISEIVGIAAGLGITKVRLTGGEPTVRRGVVDLVRQISDIPEIANVAMTTNGVLLPSMAGELKRAGLSRVNVSIDSLDREMYATITRRDWLDDALMGVDSALDAGFGPVKINCVAVRRLNQDFFRFASMSIDRPLHVRFIEYMPIGESSGTDGTGWGSEDVIWASEILERINAEAVNRKIGELVPLEGADEPFGAGPARYFAFPGAQGTVGFISPLSHRFCGECNRLRLTADGKIRPCLFSDTEFDVKTALREGGEDAARDVLLEALAAKPDSHHDRVGTGRKMSQIGG